jgi:hypothetical protein
MLPVPMMPIFSGFESSSGAAPADGTTPADSETAAMNAVNDDLNMFAPPFCEHQNIAHPEGPAWHDSVTARRSGGENS